MILLALHLKVFYAVVIMRVLKVKYGVTFLRTYWYEILRHSDVLRWITSERGWPTTAYISTIRTQKSVEGDSFN